MKIKGLLLGMFACAALVACTNDDIVENNGNEQPEKVKANLTLVIGAATDSSRATDSEDSDSKDAGTTDESNVNDAVVILNYIGTEGSEVGTTYEVAKYLEKNELNGEGSGNNVVYKPRFQLEKSGWYKVVVILNPCQDIKNAVTAFNNSGTVPNGSTCMYSYITGYSVSGDTSTDAITTANGKADNFMMVNRDEVEVNVISNQSVDPSKTEIIEVERVVSKISFIASTNVEGGTNNLYSVNVNTAQYTANTVNGWRVEGGIATKMNNMSIATLDKDGTTIYLHQGVAYVTNSDQYQGGASGEYVYTPYVGTPGNYTYQTTKTSDGTDTWYVKLDKYALVNLSNSVYAVRHLNNTSWSAPKVFGKLSDTYTYIVDPNTTNKNNEVAGTYFYNARTDIMNAKVDGLNDDDTDFNRYFKDLPDGTKDENNVVGTPLAYCFENSIDKELQTPANVTGIVFRGQICDSKGDAVSHDIYEYNKKYYLTLDDICADNNEISSITEAAANSTKYVGGHCYYYSSDITHFSNSDMEHAIMRNNVYALKVTGFESIGSADVTIPDGTVDVDKNFYVRLNASILQWKVRLNEITLQ